MPGPAPAAEILPQTYIPSWKGINSFNPGDNPIRETRCRGNKKLAQGHRASKSWNPDAVPGSLTQNPAPGHSAVLTSVTIALPVLLLRQLDEFPGGHSNDMMLYFPALPSIYELIIPWQRGAAMKCPLTLSSFLLMSQPSEKWGALHISIHGFKY